MSSFVVLLHNFVTCTVALQKKINIYLVRRLKQFSLRIIFKHCLFISMLYLISRCRNFAESSLARILNLKTGKDAKLILPASEKRK